MAAFLPVSVQGRLRGVEVRKGWMEVGELCTLDRCCLEACIPQAQPVLHHLSIRNNRSLLLRAVCSLESERERECTEDLGEKVMHRDRD